MLSCPVNVQLYQPPSHSVDYEVFYITLMTEVDVVGKLNCSYTRYVLRFVALFV